MLPAGFSFRVVRKSTLDRRSNRLHGQDQANMLCREKQTWSEWKDAMPPANVEALTTNVSGNSILNPFCALMHKKTIMTALLDATR